MVYLVVRKLTSSRCFTSNTFPCLLNNNTYQWRLTLTCNNTWVLLLWFRVPRPTPGTLRPRCKRPPNRISPVKDRSDHKILVYVSAVLIRPSQIQNGKMNIAVTSASSAIVGKCQKSSIQKRQTENLIIKILLVLSQLFCIHFLELFVQVFFIKILVQSRQQHKSSFSLRNVSISMRRKLQETDSDAREDQNVWNSSLISRIESL